MRHDSFRAALLELPQFRAGLARWSRALAEHFGAQPDRFAGDDGRSEMNVRKLRYAARYLLAAGMWEEAGRWLCSLASMQAMCEAGMSLELKAVYGAAVRAMPADAAPEGAEWGPAAVRTFYRFFLRMRRVPPPLARPASSAPYPAPASRQR